jgi:hypothetical protein
MTIQDERRAAEGKVTARIEMKDEIKRQNQLTT